MNAGHPLATALDAAEMLTARGWVVFPADNPDAGLACTGSAHRCIERRCGAQTDPRKRGKHPRVERWGALGVASTGQLAEWFADGAPLANVALACGPSGLMVVDEDTDGALCAYADSIGEVVPATFRVRTGRGWHWYFLVPIDPATGQRYRIGNSPGALGAWGCDVRGGASESGEHGGYVITAGSRHWSGITYTADEPYREAVPAPGWLIAAVLAPYTAPPSDPAQPVNGAAPVGGGDVGGSGVRGGSARAGATLPGAARRSQGVARWDKETRYGSAIALAAQFERHCGEVVHTGAEFRHELFRAARDGWRLVALDLLDEAIMLDRLAQCVGRVWHAEPDDRDVKIVYEEALDGPSGARESPWEVIEPVPPIERREITPGSLFTRPGDVVPAGQGGSAPPVDGQRAVAPARDTTQLDLPPSTGNPALDHEVERVALQRLAREIVDSHGRELVEPEDLDGYLDGPGPDYLVPGMVHRDGLAVVFGLPSAGKTYVTLDMCLSFAAGEPWAVGGGVSIALPDGTPGIVHYVMAEAPRVNVGRINAWLAHHGRTREDIRSRFYPFVRRFKLTEADIQRYLPRVRRDKPDLIVLDTKNAMYEGKESAGDDIGAMLRIIAAIREAAGECAIVLVDHPGLNAPNRVRGSNAEEGGTESMIIVEKGKDGAARTVRVTRDKAAPEESFPEWLFRLTSVPGVSPAKGVAPSAVCVPAEADGTPFIRPSEDWWMDIPPDEATDLVNGAKYEKGTQKGKAMRGKATALDIIRLLRSIGGTDGLTTDGLSKRLREGPREHTPAQVDTGLALLIAKGIVEHPAGSTARYVLVARFGPEGDAI